MENLLKPVIFTSVEDALNAIGAAEYPNYSKKSCRNVNLKYNWDNDSWYVKLTGFRMDTRAYPTPLEALQKTYDYLVWYGVEKYQEK